MGNVSDQPHKRPSTGVKAFATAQNGPNPPKQATKRPPEVIEALLEEVVARQASSTALLEKLAEDSPTKSDFRLVYQETRATRKLLEQHMKEEVEERKARAHRDQAIMGMLGDILARLPST